jgi:hypothetical protein
MVDSVELFEKQVKFWPSLQNPPFLVFDFFGSIKSQQLGNKL